MQERIKVLIIDDEAPFCEFVKEALEKGGPYEVLMSTTASSGLDMIAEQTPDLVLMDVMLHGSGTDGGKVAGLILENDATRRIPIVFVTGLVTRDELEERSGMVHGYRFIAKPMTRMELLCGVKEALDEGWA